MTATTSSLMSGLDSALDVEIVVPAPLPPEARFVAQVREQPMRESPHVATLYSDDGSIVLGEARSEAGAIVQPLRFVFRGAVTTGWGRGPYYFDALRVDLPAPTYMNFLVEATFGQTLTDPAAAVAP